MPSLSMKSNDASCGVGGEKRRHQEMTQSSDSDDDAFTLFNKAQDQVRAAQLQLNLAQQNLERRRQQIRSGGNYEPDSLFCLCDGEGHLLAHIIDYLDINDLGRCGEVCRTLKNQTDGCWDKFETKLLTHVGLRSPNAQNSKERVVRYLRASAYAKRIGAMGDNISRHTFVIGDSGIELVRCENHCEGCDFPNMNFHHAPSNPSTVDEYELFVRFSKTSNNEVLVEGFPAIGFSDSMLLEVLDFSNWPELLELNRRIDALGNEFNGREDFHWELPRDVMSKVTVVVVAVKEVTLEISLVAANSDLGVEVTLDTYDFAQGSCTHEGGLLPSSHGPFDENGERKRLELDFFTSEVSAGEEVKCNCYWELSLKDHTNEEF